MQHTFNITENNVSKVLSFYILISKAQVSLGFNILLNYQVFCLFLSFPFYILLTYYPEAKDSVCVFFFGSETITKAKYYIKKSILYYSDISFICVYMYCDFCVKSTNNDKLSLI